MSVKKPAPDSPQSDEEIVRERLGDHREVLERLAELDTPLSDDAQRALEILDGGDQS